MRKIIIIAALVTATAAHAELPSCDVLAKFAGMTMIARQNGVTAANQMAIATKNFAPTSEDYRFVTATILKAYDVPAMLTTENKQRSVTEFESEVFVACLRSRKY